MNKFRKLLSNVVTYEDRERKLNTASSCGKMVQLDSFTIDNSDSINMSVHKTFGT